MEFGNIIIIIIIIIQHYCWNASLRLLSVILPSKICSIYGAPLPFNSQCRGYNNVNADCTSLQRVTVGCVQCVLTTPVDCSGAFKAVLLVAFGFQSADSLRSKWSNIMLLFCWLGDNVGMRSATALATTALKAIFVD